MNYEAIFEQLLPFAKFSGKQFIGVYGTLVYQMNFPQEEKTPIVISFADNRTHTTGVFSFYAKDGVILLEYDVKSDSDISLPMNCSEVEKKILDLYIDQLIQDIFVHQIGIRERNREQTAASFMRIKERLQADHPVKKLDSLVIDSDMVWEPMECLTTSDGDSRTRYEFPMERNQYFFVMKEGNKWKWAWIVQDRTVCEGLEENEEFAKDVCQNIYRELIEMGLEVKRRE